MRVSDAMIEQAEARVEAERDGQVARIRARLPRGPERLTCVCCGEMIPEARRLAVPGISSCYECAARAERRRA